jgi:hypothetical protein
MNKIFNYGIGFILLFAACENLVDHVYRIRVRNHSPQSIEIFAGYFLPDTLLPIIKPEMKIIQSGEFKDIYDSDVGDEKFKRFRNNEKLTVFILSSDTISKYAWETIVDNYMILERAEISPDDLGDYGSITYP